MLLDCAANSRCVRPESCASGPGGSLYYDTVSKSTFSHVVVVTYVVADVKKGVEQVSQHLSMTWATANSNELWSTHGFAASFVRVLSW